MKRQTHRRTFLRDGILIGVGAPAGALLPTAFGVFTKRPALGQEKPPKQNAESRLRELVIKLPPPPQTGCCIRSCRAIR